MHHGHMPEITLSGADEAEGVWYLEDIFIDVEQRTHTIGSAIYKDRYCRVNGQWQIARSEYDRVFELVTPLSEDAQVTSHHLATAGRKPHERVDISHLIQWVPTAPIAR